MSFRMAGGRFLKKKTILLTGMTLLLFLQT